MSKNNGTDTKSAEQTAAAGTAMYTPQELASAAKKAFGVQPEVVLGALQFKYKGNKQKFTKAEAKTAIKSFLAKEVK